MNRGVTRVACVASCVRECPDLDEVEFIYSAFVNRREALQRLAAAGATIGAVSAVTSSVAFADGGSTNCQPNPGQNIPHPFWSTAACTVVATVPRFAS